MPFFLGRSEPGRLALGAGLRDLFDSIQALDGSQRRQAPSPDQDSIIFYADFESTSGPNNWTAVDLTNPGPTWHRDYYNAYSGQSCGPAKPI